MDLYWGIKENNKRKFDEMDSDGDSDRETMEPDRKKFKLFKNDKMIYTIDNEIHFTMGVTSTSIETLIKKITKLINKNNDKYKGSKEQYELIVVIDSPGGSVSAILKFVDFLTLVKKKYPFVTFTSIVSGCAASAGSIMSVSMDKRLMTRNATLMIHELASGNQGKYTELKSYSKHLTDLHDQLVNIYLQKCKNKCSREQIEDLLKSETWLRSDEAVKYGLVDEVIG